MRSGSPLSRHSVILAVLLCPTVLLVVETRALADNRDVPNFQARTNGEHTVWVKQTGSGPDLALLNLEMGVSSEIATAEAHEGPADIDGDWVIWIENSFPWGRVDCTNRILAKKIDSDETFALAENLLGPTAPTVSGNLVVWGSLKGVCPTESAQASVTDESVLAVFDLNEMAVVANLGPFPGQVNSVAIDGEHIIWSQRSDSKNLPSGDIYYVQVGSDAAPVKLGRALEGSYDVSGDTVVFVDGRNQLTIVDLASGETRILNHATEGGDLRSPRKIRYSTIDGTYVAWDQLTNSGGWQLNAYSLATETHYVLDSSEWPHQPHLQSGTLVWQSGSDRSGYGIRSASVDDFERLHDVETRNVAIEVLLWSGAALGTVAIAGITWRHVRGAWKPFRSAES